MSGYSYEGFIDASPPGMSGVPASDSPYGAIVIDDNGSVDGEEEEDLSEDEGIGSGSAMVNKRSARLIEDIGANVISGNTLGAALTIAAPLIIEKSGAQRNCFEQPEPFYTNPVQPPENGEDLIGDAVIVDSPLIISTGVSPKLTQHPEHGSGFAIQVKRGDSFQKLLKSVYGDRSSRAMGKLVINHPLNSLVKRTEKYGYDTLYGQSGPELTAKYSGIYTQYRSGAEFPVLWYPEVA
jgi:hypothetical protein